TCSIKPSRYDSNFKNDELVLVGHGPKSAGFDAVAVPYSGVAYPPRPACTPSELVPDSRADLGQTRVDAGAEARVRDVLDVGDDVEVLIELVAEAARFAEGEPAAHVDATLFWVGRRVIDRAAELALEEEPLVDRDAPGEAGKAVACLAAGVDHRA